MKWNDINSANSLIRIENAYQHWVNDNQRSIRYSAQLFKTSPVRVKKYALEKGATLTSHNVNIFNEIDTEEKAYWLGFLFADGAVSIKTNLLEISLATIDIDHLEKFKKFASCTNNITIESVQNDKYSRCRIVLGSPQLKQDLIKWGCTPQKTFTIRYPKNLSTKFSSAFVRGVFDGDGSITRSCKDCLYDSCSLCSASKIFLEELSKVVEKECGIVCKLYKQSRGSNTWLIVLNSLNFKKFITWLYFDSKVHLDRKYKRFLTSSAIMAYSKKINN